MPESVLTFQDLKERKRWPYTRQHTARMVKEGRFPRPFKMESGGINLWLESEIDAWFAERAKQARGIRPASG
jgi:prophage regulatory protein